MLSKLGLVKVSVAKQHGNRCFLLGVQTGLMLAIVIVLLGTLYETRYTRGN